MNRRIQWMPSSGATTALFVFLCLFRVVPTAGSFNHSCAALSPDSVPHRVRVFSRLSPRVFPDRQPRRLFSLPTSSSSLGVSSGLRVRVLRAEGDPSPGASEDFPVRYAQPHSWPILPCFQYLNGAIQIGGGTGTGVTTDGFHQLP